MRIQTMEYELTMEINELRMGEMRKMSENIIRLTNEHTIKQNADFLQKKFI